MQSDLFERLAQWADLLPGVEKKGPKATEKLNRLGEEIKQLCAQAENNAQPQPALVEVKKESTAEIDFKPSFVFQLTTDDLINPMLPTFDCVFDFCEKLAEYCETSTAKHLNIDRDWHKLLLACSSNNYDRFMWIHLTFQSSNNLKLDWSQVRRRLMSKFDVPTRRDNVMKLISDFKYVPELGTIESANKGFQRLADEVEINTITSYANILPPSLKDVVMSTITYDALTDFPCDLKDIMQRAAVFATATDDDFIFYSKTAHLAVRLDHQKVNQKDCEFHLLAEHSTSACPDYVIVKYPYMAFTPLSTSYMPRNNSNSSVPVAPAPVTQLNIMDSSFQPSIPSTSASQQAVGDNQLTSAADVPIKNEPTTTTTTTPAPASNDAVMVTNDNQFTTQELLNQPITKQGLNNQSITTITTQELNTQPTATTTTTAAAAAATQELIKQPIQELVRQAIAEAVQEQPLTNQTQDENFQNMDSTQLMTQICSYAGTSKNIPPILMTLLEQKLNEEMVVLKGTPVTTTTRPQNNTSSPSSYPSTRGDRREESSNSSSSRRRSRSPERTYHRRERSDSPEQGCVFHGRNVSHNTKECRQAQMVISSRRGGGVARSSRNNEPLTPPPPANNKKSRSRKHKDSTHCIFCGLLFKPGHLGVCKEVRSKPPNMRK
ncbi:hypothetical protein BD770DRAFT_393216 [Pilaira anomala]|nr:hypothetical protein BD770DRAFT_393216 [Pilaira anomala]